MSSDSVFNSPAARQDLVPFLPAGDRLRVLIVDDRTDFSNPMAMLIGSWGFQVREARTGAAALRMAQEFRPRVVLLDLGLPDMHGYDLARALRAEAQLRSMFFVAITGWNQIADQLRSGAAGIAHHLVKPVHPTMLREILVAYQGAEAAHLALDSA